MPNLEHIFTHKNLDCVIVNNETHRCGYVGCRAILCMVKIIMMFWKTIYSVHGGLTYSSSEHLRSIRFTKKIYGGSDMTVPIITIT